LAPPVPLRPHAGYENGYAPGYEASRVVFKKGNACSDGPERDDKRGTHAHRQCDPLAIIVPATLVVAVLGDPPGLLKALGFLHGPFGQGAARGTNMLPFDALPRGHPVVDLLGTVVIEVFCLVLASTTRTHVVCVACPRVCELVWVVLDLPKKANR